MLLYEFSFKMFFFLHIFMFTFHGSVSSLSTIMIIFLPDQQVNFHILFLGSSNKLDTEYIHFFDFSILTSFRNNLGNTYKLQLTIL